MWFRLAALLLIAYLPGALLFRAPVADRSRRAALAADERAFWAILLSIAWSLSVTLALAAGGAYTLTRLLLVNAATCLLIAALARARLRFGPGAPRPNAAALIPLGLVALGWWVFVPPAEYVIGGKDPGIYVNEGIQIARTGSLVIDDPVVASVPPEARDLFFPSHQNPTYYGLRFMGFFILDPGAGTVVGQFPHLYPASIAIAYGLDGLTGARRATSAWGILGVLAVYFAGARLLGRPAAAAGSALLALNVVQVWFARYPNAEIVMQALLFAALLANARASVDGDSFFAPVAGALLALLVFLRYDGLLALASVAGALAVGWLQGRRTRWPLVVSTLIGLALAGWYLATLMKPYFEYPLALTLERGPLRLLVLWCGAIGALAFASRRPRLAAPLRALVAPALVVAVVAAATYAYFLRHPGGRTPLHDAMALRSFAWYVTPFGLFAAVAGFALTGLRSFWRDPAFFLTVTGFAAFFFSKIRIVPEHFWMSRRFVAVILPAALLLAAGAAFRLLGEDGVSRIWRPRPRSAGRARAATIVVSGLPVAVAAAVVALLGWQFVTATRAIVHHVEYAGVIPRLEQLQRRFGDSDLVLVESRNASDTHVLALPLAYIYARNVLVLDSPRPDRKSVARFLAGARTRYREIFFIGGGGTDLLSRSLAVTALGSERFQLPEYDSPRNAYPGGVRYKEFDFGIYRFVPPRPSAGWFTLDVGTMDDLHVVRFHAKERMGPHTFRWTRDVSYISITAVAEGSRLITLWLNDGRRPPGVEPAHTAVSLNGRLLGGVTVTPDFHPYSFAIPREVSAELASGDEPGRLMLQTNTWSPRAALGTADDRQLGVMVDRVEVK